MDSFFISPQTVSRSAFCLSGEYSLERQYFQALLALEGLGNLSIWKLLAVFGSAQSIWEASPEQLTPHLGRRQLNIFLRHRAQEPFPVLHPQQLALEAELGVQAVAITDAHYPLLLREIYNPPLVLYYRGSIKALTGRTLAFVGTRQASDYGRRVTERLVQTLAPAGVVVVSGLAAGIDTVAHWQALRSGVPTVAVFGCGLDICYPSSNRGLAEEILSSDGAWISEYPVGTQPSRFTFPQRNRIVAGLSHGVLVLEGSEKSGALITARLAAEEGRSVYAIPGSIFDAGSAGPHQLIRSGALVVTEAAQVLADLNWQALPNHPDFTLSAAGFSEFSTPPLPADLSLDALTVLKSLDNQPIAVDDLPQATGFSSAKINELLTLLELEGLIVLLPGARVCRS